jgi:hypothetical protein
MMTSLEYKEQRCDFRSTLTKTGLLKRWVVNVIRTYVRFTFIDQQTEAAHVVTFTSCVCFIDISNLTSFV